MNIYHAKINPVHNAIIFTAYSKLFSCPLEVIYNLENAKRKVKIANINNPCGHFFDCTQENLEKALFDHIENFGLLPNEYNDEAYTVMKLHLIKTNFRGQYPIYLGSFEVENQENFLLNKAKEIWGNKEFFLDKLLPRLNVACIDAYERLKLRPYYTPNEIEIGGVYNAFNGGYEVEVLSKSDDKIKVLVNYPTYDNIADILPIEINFKLN